jgi:hypothetical protein
VRSARLAWLVLGLALLASGRVQAESKWSFKKMVPAWGKKDTPPSGLYSKSKEPSMWTKVSSSSKRMVAKSKEAVPDWLMPETQGKVRKSSDAVKSSAERVREEARTARRNIFAPWSSTEQEEEKERPKTVPDFLALPKPE